MKKQTNNIWPYFAAISAAMIFGFSFLFTKSALDDLQIFQLLGLRFGVAAIFLTILVVARVVRLNIVRDNLKDLIMIALLQPVLYFIFETVGVKLTSASESGIIIALVPISITVFAILILKERITGNQFLFIIVSIIGVILIVLSNTSIRLQTHLSGIAALLGAVAAAGLYNVFSRKVSAKYTPVEITFVMMWFGAIAFNIAGLTTSMAEGTMSNYMSALKNLSTIFDISYLGILSSVAAFFMLNYALSKMEASRSGVFMNLTPVISVIAGVIFRGERLYLLQGVGAILILTGIWGSTQNPNLTVKGKAAAKV